MDGLNQILGNPLEAQALLYAFAKEKGESHHNKLFYDGEVIENVALYYLISCRIRVTGWNESDRRAITRFLRRQFATLVRSGSFVRVKSDTLARYKCVKEPVPHSSSITDAHQLTLSFESEISKLDSFTRPSRYLSIIERIVRDGDKVLKLKNLYDYRCCLCQIRLQISATEWLCEVHHLRPLGQPHNGPDTLCNMVVLCPNHHALFDAGVPVWETDGNIVIGEELFQPIFKHEIAADHVNYYRKNLQRPERRKDLKGVSVFSRAWSGE